uniref:Uncharacterized protein n=1 Tax=Romanomermis culicivorax TaxID=13658 RepID=A0A915HSZ0_ROMCU
MWQKSIKRFSSHIDQEPAGSHCSYRKINHEMVLCIDPFPTMFQSHIVVDRANRPKPSVQNPKKTKQQLEEEEDEQYALVDKMEHCMVTDPARRREYEALGGYLSSDASDTEPIVARMAYGPHFVGNNPLCEPTMFHDDVGLQHLKLFPYLFASTNIWNVNRVANEISLILYYFWPRLKIDDKVVKQIVSDGPTPGAKHRNDVALGTLIAQEPHGVGNKTMDYMYNRFNIVPIIFKETRTKRPAEGHNITIDKCYNDNCWFFKTS